MRPATLFSLHFSTIGLLTGTVFLAFSLAPSLVPRPPLTQGIISGLSLITGYAIGVFGRWLWTYLELPMPAKRTERILKNIATVACALVVVTFLWRASAWQDSVRALMEMEETGGMQLVGLAGMVAALSGRFPIVTMLQLMADMWAGTAPPGYGHNYAAEHYLEAWLFLTEPKGWDAEAIQRLKLLHTAREE